MLELSVSIDSATLQLLILDLGCDFGSIAHADHSLATHSPSKWAEEFSAATFRPENRCHQVDIYRAQRTAQADRVYIENLVLHPVKVTLSFVQTSAPRTLLELSFAGSAVGGGGGGGANSGGQIPRGIDSSNGGGSDNSDGGGGGDGIPPAPLASAMAALSYIPAFVSVDRVALKVRKEKQTQS